MTEPTPPIEQKPPTEQKQQLAEDGHKKAVNNDAASIAASSATAQVLLPRVTIKYCTQCRWMLRAAYFAQELLSTFSTSLGEVALIPATGGVFTVTIYHRDINPADQSSPSTTIDDRAQTLATNETVLWDRKTEGGFPEVKQLKARVRNIVDPARDLGHVDRALTTAAAAGGKSSLSPPSITTSTATAVANSGKKEKEKACEDCQ